jgi:hypothetical protein
MELMGLDVWMRYSGPKSAPFVTHHRVWDRKLFVSRRAVPDKDGTKGEPITQEQFKREGGK